MALKPEDFDFSQEGEKLLRDYNSLGVGVFNLVRDDDSVTHVGTTQTSDPRIALGTFNIVKFPVLPPDNPKHGTKNYYTRNLQIGKANTPPQSPPTRYSLPRGVWEGNSNATLGYVSLFSQYAQQALERYIDSPDIIGEVIEKSVTGGGYNLQLNYRIRFTPTPTSYYFGAVTTALITLSATPVSTDYYSANVELDVEGGVLNAGVGSSLFRIPIKNTDMFSIGAIDCYLSKGEEVGVFLSSDPYPSDADFITGANISVAQGGHLFQPAAANSSQIFYSVTNRYNSPSLSTSASGGNDPGNTNYRLNELAIGSFYGRLAGYRDVGYNSTLTARGTSSTNQAIDPTEQLFAYAYLKLLSPKSIPVHVNRVVDYYQAIQPTTQSQSTSSWSLSAFDGDEYISPYGITTTIIDDGIVRYKVGSSSQETTYRTFIIIDNSLGMAPIYSSYGDVDPDRPAIIIAKNTSSKASYTVTVYDRNEDSELDVIQVVQLANNSAYTGTFHYITVKLDKTNKKVSVTINYTVGTSIVGPVIANCEVDFSYEGFGNLYTATYIPLGIYAPAYNTFVTNSGTVGVATIYPIDYTEDPFYRHDTEIDYPPVEALPYAIDTNNCLKLFPTINVTDMNFYRTNNGEVEGLFAVVPRSLSAEYYGPISTVMNSFYKGVTTYSDATAFDLVVSLAMTVPDDLGTIRDRLVGLRLSFTEETGTSGVVTTIYIKYDSGSGFYAAYPTEADTITITGAQYLESQDGRLVQFRIPLEQIPGIKAGTNASDVYFNGAGGWLEQFLVTAYLETTIGDVSGYDLDVSTGILRFETDAVSSAVNFNSVKSSGGRHISIVPNITEPSAQSTYVHCLLPNQYAYVRINMATNSPSNSISAYIGDMIVHSPNTGRQYGGSTTTIDVLAGGDHPGWVTFVMEHQTPGQYRIRVYDGTPETSMTLYNTTSFIYTNPNGAFKVVGGFSGSNGAFSATIDIIDGVFTD